MELWLIIAAAALLLGGLLFLAVKKKPEIIALPFRPLARIPRVRKWMEKKAVQAMAAKPEEIEKNLGPAAKPLQEAMAKKTQAQREETLQKAIDLGESGKMQQAAEVLRQKPKTPEEQRAAAKKKAAARAKRKRAKKQKRKR